MIDEKDIERLREIFITRQECQNNLDGIENKLSKDLVRLAVIENQLKLVLGVLTAVGGGMLTVLLKLFFGG
jgi:hypothetical protein